jgi:hypothetical protein
VLRTTTSGFDPSVDEEGRGSTFLLLLLLPSEVVVVV